MVTTYTFPRVGQMTDMIKFLGEVPRMEEMTYCAWITPFNLDTTLTSHPVSYATSVSPNTFYLQLERDSLTAAFRKDYKFTGNSFQVNVQVRCIYDVFKN